MVMSLPTKKKIFEVLESVRDPEIPALTVREMGMLRDIELDEDGKIIIHFTPTYSGCPATDLIKVDIMAALQEAGYKNIEIRDVLSPPWTTDVFTPETRAKLKASGITPPVETTSDKRLLLSPGKTVPCPYCDSNKTELLSSFGTTACKSLYRCLECLQPFDYFKCH